MRPPDITLTPVDAPKMDKKGDWYHIDGLGDGLEVHVMVDRDSGERPLIKLVQVQARSVLTTHLRDIPLGQIERLANHTIAVVGTSESGDHQLQRPAALHRRLEGEDDVAFTHRVARSYRYWATQTNAPSRAIADESGVPVGTVRRWVREARKAGALEPGQRGRAG